MPTASLVLPPPPPLADLLARGDHALFLDFDGTLVEIAERPDAIAVPGSISARLHSLSERLGGRLAVVSGRGIDDLETHCGPLGVSLAGSHGAHRRWADGRVGGSGALTLPDAVIDAVAKFALREGLSLERKPHGAALHSRSVPEKEGAALAFMQQLAARHGLLARRGKRVVELVHVGADKGAAVDHFMAHPPFRGAVPVFVGDDVTDEDGIAACARLGGFGIAVGERESEGARYRLEDPAAVREWLAL